MKTKSVIMPDAQSVLECLATLAQLPKEGYLAGGAVVNTILALIDHKPYPVNDLDVFCAKITDSDHVAASSAVPGAQATCFPFELRIEEAVPIGISEEIEGPYADLSANIRKPYRVHSSRRDGILNFIEIALEEDGYFENCPGSNMPSLYALLDAFDLNACQAGIDLATKELVVTDAFKHFLKTRQLKVWNPGTPFRTAIRLAKKKDDLGAYCDLAGEVAFLATAQALKQKTYFTSRDIPSCAPADDFEPAPCAPEVCVDWYEESVSVESVHPASDEYFKALQGDECSEELSELVSCETPDSVMQKIKPYLVPLVDTCGLQLSAELTEKFRKVEGELSGLVFSRVVDGDLVAWFEPGLISERVVRVLRWSNNHPVAQSTYVRRLWDALERPQTPRSIKEATTMALQYDVIRAAILNHDNFVGTQVSTKQLGFVQKYLAQHNHQKLIPLFGKTFDELYRSVTVLAGLRDIGQIAIGALEKDEITIRLPLTVETVQGQVRGYLDKLSHDRLVKPLWLPKLLFPKNAQVRELVTVADLVSEGARMSHCVGGYARSVKTGISRIFHLDCNGEHSTLEFYVLLGHPRPARLAQQRGRFNASVSKAESRIGLLLQSYLRAYDVLLHPVISMTRGLQYLLSRPTGRKLQLEMRALRRDPRSWLANRFTAHGKDGAVKRKATPRVRRQAAAEQELAPF